jgi:hypothetical protein
MTRSKSIIVAAAAALSLGIVSQTLTPLDNQPPLSKSDILIAASDDAATGAAANVTEGSAKMGTAHDNKNNVGQTVNAQGKSDKLTGEPSLSK